MSVRFVYETGSWKILDAQWSNTTIDPASLYALIPPGDGAFARAGSPWDRVEAAQGTKKWKLRAVSDESYLYLRIEASAVLPAPNTEVAGTFPNLSTGVPRDWPKMKIRTAKGEFTMDAFDGVGDKATFDAAGKANSHRHFVAYSMMLWRGDHVVVNTSEEPLIAIRDRFIDLRIPLKTLGVEARARIAIADANLPASFVTYQGKPF